MIPACCNGKDVSFVPRGNEQLGKLAVMMTHANLTAFRTNSHKGVIAMLISVFVIQREREGGRVGGKEGGVRREGGGEKEGRWERKGE